MDKDPVTVDRKVIALTVRLSRVGQQCWNDLLEQHRLQTTHHSFIIFCPKAKKPTSIPKLEDYSALRCVSMW